MGLYISLKRKVKDEDFNRFKSAFFVFDELFKAIKIKNIKIAFYKDYPLPEFNKDFKREDFEFGLLESSFRAKLKDMSIESMRAGFEIEAELVLDKDKKFNLLYELFPRNKSRYYDIRIGLLPNGYAEDIEDIEKKFYPKFREYLLKRIVEYNKISEKKKENLFLIKRALISDHGDEFHSIEKWSFFYSKEPEEFINNLSYGDKEMRERLLYANRDKFAEFLKNLNLFVIKMYDYAEQSNVMIKDGSIAVIPESPESMSEFVGKLREKVGLSVRELYPNKDEIESNVKKVFSD